MTSWIENWKTILRRYLIVPIVAIAMLGAVVTYDLVKPAPAKAAIMILIFPPSRNASDWRLPLSWIP